LALLQLHDFAAVYNSGFRREALHAVTGQVGLAAASDRVEFVSGVV